MACEGLKEAADAAQQHWSNLMGHSLGVCAAQGHSSSECQAAQIEAQDAYGAWRQAVNAYNVVTAAVVTEMGARAQLNIGLCRLAQKRYAEASTALLVVPFTYDYPELTAVALLEAARALAEDKQREKAVQLLQRLLRDHPDGDPAEAARKRLEELRKG